jgi:hypothetical protein
MYWSVQRLRATGEVGWDSSSPHLNGTLPLIIDRDALCHHSALRLEGLVAGQIVRLESERTTVVVAVRVDPDLLQGKSRSSEVPSRVEKPEGVLEAVGAWPYLV